MLFNDYAKGLKKQYTQLSRLDMIIYELRDILNFEENFLKEAFKNSYLGLLRQNNNNFISQAGFLSDYSEDIIKKTQHRLISIDFTDFAFALSDFKNTPEFNYILDNENLFNKFMSYYKTIHKFKRLTSKASIADGYFDCMDAIKNMIRLYDEFKLTSNYVNELNTMLCKGYSEEGLEIQLLNSTFDKDSYNKVVYPVYDIYYKLCEIAGVKDEISILRIESGSLFAKFSGNIDIFKLTVKIIDSAHDLCIRKFTQKGKKQNIAESVELFGKQIEIMKTLKDLGFDVNEHEEIANETLGLLLKKSNILLSSSPDIKINNKILSKSDSVKKLLEQENLKQLAATINDDSEDLDQTINDVLEDPDQIIDDALEDLDQTIDDALENLDLK